MASDPTIDWRGLTIVIGGLGAVLAGAVKWLDIRTDTKTSAAIAPLELEIKTLKESMEKGQRLILLAIIALPPDCTETKVLLRDASDALVQGFKA